MDNLNRETLRLLRPQIEAALAELGTTHGIKFMVGGGKYDPDMTTTTLKLELAVTNGRAEVSPVIVKAERAWRECAQLYGLKPEWLGKSFRIGQDKGYTILGLEPSRTKFPVLVRTQAGKEVLLKASDVAKACAAADDVAKPGQSANGDEVSKAA